MAGGRLGWCLTLTFLSWGTVLPKVDDQKASKKSPQNPPLSRLAQPTHVPGCSCARLHCSHGGSEGDKWTMTLPLPHQGAPKGNQHPAAGYGVSPVSMLAPAVEPVPGSPHPPGWSPGTQPSAPGGQAGPARRAGAPAPEKAEEGRVSSQVGGPQLQHQPPPSTRARFSLGHSRPAQCRGHPTCTQYSRGQG